MADDEGGLCLPLLLLSIDLLLFSPVSGTCFDLLMIVSEFVLLRMVLLVVVVVAAVVPVLVSVISESLRLSSRATSLLDFGGCRSDPIVRQKFREIRLNSFFSGINVGSS